MLVQAKAEMAPPDAAPAAIVESQGLTKVFRRLLAGGDKAVYALRDVSLSVHAGQIVAIRQALGLAPVMG